MFDKLTALDIEKMEEGITLLAVVLGWPGAQFYERALSDMDREVARAKRQLEAQQPAEHHFTYRGQCAHCKAWDYNKDEYNGCSNNAHDESCIFPDCDRCE